jgi:hypothetical protein
MTKIMRWLAFSLFSICCVSCQSHPEKLQNKAAQEPEAATGAPPEEAPYFNCDKPTEVGLNQWFTIDCTVFNGGRASITADNNEFVEYRPSHFPIEPGQTQLVRVKIKHTRSGLVELALFPDRVYGYWYDVVDVGFGGHLKPVSVAALSYDVPTTMSIEVVDDIDKPIAVPGGMEIRVQAVGAQLSLGRKTSGEGAAPQEFEEAVTLPFTAGARASPQFQLKSTAWQGGTIRLLASLETTKEYPLVVTQGNLSFQVNPVWWLPIVLAMSGSFLYWAYSFAKKPKVSSAILPEIIASMIGGLIAYLFAGFDLLGLKLDPNILKTYPILGFLFAYAGIEVLLGKRFRGGEGKKDDKRRNTDADSKQNEATSQAAV